VEWLARLRSPGARAQRSAGPPTAWTAAALGVGFILAVIAAIAAGAPDVRWIAAGLLGPALVPGIADRNGWAVRAAMAYVAIQQRRQWRHGSLPVTPAAANAWLERRTSEASTPLERASVLVTAGRQAEALAAIDAADASTDVDRVRQLRLRSTVAAMSGGGEIDLARIGTAASALPLDQRRYQVVSAAWSQAWLDLSAGRPWRDRFAAVAREYGPYPLPRRVWVFGIAMQQLALPVAVVLACGIVSAVEGLL
jgi:hypothetical protein